jgi:hypothetical protein
MAKKQTRRSISVSRTTYERLKSFCETNNISMSQFVEARVGDFLGEGAATGTTSIVPSTPRPTMPAPVKTAMPAPVSHPARNEAVAMAAAPSRPSSPAIPMTSAAARYAVEPPPPVIKRRDEPSEPAPKPAEKRPDQIFTF